MLEGEVPAVVDPYPFYCLLETEERECNHLGHLTVPHFRINSGVLLHFNPTVQVYHLLHSNELKEGPGEAGYFVSININIHTYMMTINIKTFGVFPRFAIHDYVCIGRQM